ncbi:MAG: hypothetical protein U0401_18320 [Anaerolineae bacterium]
MNITAVNQIAQLLSQAGSVHHEFEQTVLKGVYGQEWPRWYAEYVVEHGLSHLLELEVTVEQVSQFFSESYGVYKKENSQVGWTDYTAQQMMTGW